MMRRSLLLLLCLTGGFLAGQQTEVDRTPPRFFDKVLAPFLTPLAEVQDGWKQFPDDDESGVYLLDETIYYTAPDGVNYRLYQDVLWARDEAGAESLASRIYTFDRDRETIFLIAAEVVTDTGEIKPLAERAAFIQTPQYEAQNSLYTSEAELNLLFPNVQAGTIVRSVVLVREDKPVFPGEFAARFGFGGGWPAFREHLQLIQPASLLERLQTVNSRPGVPDPVRERLEDGFVRLHWQSEPRPGEPWEVGAPNFYFRVPTLWLSTLESWDQIAGWFAELVAGREELGEAMQAEVDEWTEGVSDPREILEILTAKVANEVRYTGLEFGLAGYQPYPCETVWANRYGDCKDKANLLRAMLRHKGIPAHVVLLQTSGHGRVEKRSPNWFQFNHAIVAVELEPGQFTFCDPTVERLRAGQIGLRDLDRDVLVVKDGEAVWAHTPDELNGAIRLGIEAELEPTGEIRGWFTLRGVDGDAAYYANYFGEKDDRGRRRAMQEILDDFFPGAEAIDVEFKAPEGSVDDFSVRAYFLRPGRESESLNLRFPYPPGWLPRLSSKPERDFSYSATRRIEAVDATIRLPAGWTADGLPAPYRVQADHATFAADWSLDAGGSLHAQLEYAPTRHILSKDDYEGFHRAVRALTTWLETPVAIVPGEGGESAPRLADDALEEFPMLSNAAAQLRLIDERYPEDHDKAARRQALERIPQWFPDDTNSVFDSKVKLVLLDWNDDTHAESARRLAELLAKYRSSVSALNWSWAEYLEARCRFWANEDPTAIDALIALAENPDLNDFRRGWSAYYAGRFLFEMGRADEAFAFLRAHDERESEAQESIVIRLAHEYLLARRDAEFTAWLQEFRASAGPAAEPLLASALDYTIEHRGDYERGHREKLLALWLELEGTGRPSAELGAALARLHQTLPQLNAQWNLVRVARRVLRREKPEWWHPDEDTSLESVQQAVDRIEAKDDENDGPAVVDTFLQLIEYHQPDYPVLCRYLRYSMWYLQRREFDPKLFEAFAVASLAMPEQDAGHLAGCWGLIADERYENGQIEEARSLYQKVLDSEVVASHLRAGAADDLAQLELAENRIGDALAAMAVSEEFHDSSTLAPNFLLPQLLLRLERGEFDRAEELFAKLTLVKEDYIERSSYAGQLNAFLGLREAGPARRDYWERAPLWVPDWTALLEEYGVDPLPLNELPLSRDLDALPAELADLAQKGEVAAYLSRLRLLVANARWIPALVDVFANHAMEEHGLPEPVVTGLFNCLEGMTRDWVSVDDDLDTRAVLLHVLALQRLGREEEALAIARALVDEHTVATPLGSGALNLWLILASGEAAADDEPLGRALEALQSGDPVYNRENMIAQVSDTLMTDEHAHLHRQFLEAELENPHNHFTEPLKNALERRRDFLRDSIAGGEEFAAAVRAWIEHNHLDWIDQVPLDSRDDPRFHAVETVATSENASASVSEILKYNYLLATDPATSAPVRQQAFAQVFNGLVFGFSRSDEFREAVASAALEKTFDAGVRQSMVHFGIALLALNLHPAEARSLLESTSEAVTLEAEAREGYERWIDASALLQSGAPEDLEAAFHRLNEGPLEFFGLTLLGRTIERLLYFGEDERADALFAETKALTLTPDFAAKNSVAQWRLSLMRSMRRWKADAPFYRYARERLLAAHGQAPADSSVIAAFFDFERSFWGQPEGDQLEGYLAMIDRGTFFSQPWADVFARPPDRTTFVIDHRFVGLELLDFALAAETEDEVRSAWVAVALDYCDADVPAVREQTLAKLQAFLDDPRHQSETTTLKGIHEYLIQVALRTSTEEAPAPIFGRGPEGRVDPDLLNLYRLNFALSRNQKKEVARYLDRTSAEFMASPYTYPTLSRALALLGREDEGALVNEAVAASLEKDVVDIWINPHPGQATALIRAASALGANDLVSQASIEHVLARHAGSVSGAWIRLEHAKGAGDWKTVEEAADAILAVQRELYAVFFERGLARFEQGDMDGARADLDIFLRYCRDSIDYPEALRLRARLDEETK